tara:strand:- start:358 stop:576 length:219 start_codon:yes stop_codon:yes gene_type:complete
VVVVVEVITMWQQLQVVRVVVVEIRVVPRVQVHLDKVMLVVVVWITVEEEVVVLVVLVVLVLISTVLLVELV